MTAPTDHSDPARAPQPRAPRRARRWLARLAGALALAGVTMGGAAAWLLGTQSGLDAALALGQRATDGALRVDKARGRLLGGFEAAALHYHTAAMQVDVREFVFDWQPRALFERRLVIERLGAARIDVALAPSDEPPREDPLPQPESLEIPLAVELRALTLGALALRELTVDGAAADEGATDEGAGDEAADDDGAVDGAGPVQEAAKAIQGAEDAVTDPERAAEAAAEIAAEQGLILWDLSAALASDGRHHRLQALALSVAQGRLELTAGVDGRSPFALDGEGSFVGAVEGRALAAQLAVTNTLIEPRLRVDAQSEGLEARLEADAASFAPMPLRRLALRAGELDPAGFAAGAPTAALSLEAELAPGPDGQSLLAGPLRLVNRLPQAADLGGLPLLSLEGVLDWREQEIAIDGLDIRLPADGRVSGRIAWRPPVSETPGKSDAEAAGESARADEAQSGAETAQAPGKGTEAAPVQHGKAATDIGFGQLVAALELAGIDTRALDSRLPQQIVAGRIDAEADEIYQQARVGVDVGSARIDLEASLRAEAPGAQPAGEGGGSSPAGAAAAHADGNVAPDGATPLRRFSLSAGLRGVEPRAFVPEAPAARLNLDLQAEGELPAAGLPQAAQLRFAIVDSLLEGLALSGEGRLRLEGERLPEVELALQLAGNRLRANGALGAAADRLALNLDAPALDALGLGLAGRAGAQGEIGGTLEAPAGTLQFFAEALRLPGEVRLAGINGVARLDAGADGPFTVALGLSGLGSSAPGADGKPQPDWLASARLAAEGTRAAHRIELELNTPPTEGVADVLSAQLQGGLVEGEALRWSGRLVALQSAGRVVARLLAPATLELAADAVRLGAAEINAGDKGRIRLLETAWSPTQSVLRGDLSGLTLELEPRRADGQLRRGADPLVLGARWDLSVGRTLDGEARVFRESGDVRIEGELRTRLGLERLEAVLVARGDRLNLNLDVRGSEFGSVVGEASLRAQRSADGIWSVPQETPISASARLDMPSITWLGRLARENVETAGRINGAFRVTGTLAAPVASGTVNGRELGFTLIDQGMILSGGEFDLAFDQDRVRLTRLEFVSPNRVQPRENRIPLARLTATPGRFTASGELALDSGAGDFRFAADRLPLLQRDDRWMLLSGQGTARSTWSSLVLDADFRADAGYIEFAEALPPSLSDDVVVLGRDELSEGGGFALNADIRVGLGDALYLSAMGLETRLAGELRIRLQPERPLMAVGTVSTVGGSYRGYGQNLVIERGVVNFQGPLDAPGLNIVALRKGLEVEAGVAVTGSAKRPQVRLVSEPNVPDPAKLSWIVLGRAPDAASGADLGLLLPAAAGLLGGPGGGMTEELSRSLGFDSFSIGQGELTSTTRTGTSRVLGSGSTVASGPTVSGQVLSLGKRLGPDLFLSFEQSLGGAATLVKLSYQLSRRLSVVARGGTDTAIDLNYGFSFR